MDEREGGKERKREGMRLRMEWMREREGKQERKGEDGLDEREGRK